MLNALGSCMIIFTGLARYVANLYPGLFLQLTIGLMGLPSLCNFMVPSMCGASGFMFMYFHLSACFIILLHVLIAVLMAFCSLLVWLLATLIKLLFVLNSSIFRLYSSCYIITKVLPLSVFVTIKLFCFIFFMLLMSFFSCISCLILYVVVLSFCAFSLLLVSVVYLLLLVSCVSVSVGRVDLSRCQLSYIQP
jgi:hypothetical protein